MYLAPTPPPSYGGNPQKNARIVVATYQTLDVDSDEADANFLLTNYPENYFSHIIIDECHRSAWGKWSLVLTRNPDAVQIGLTATPRQLEITEDDQHEAQADAKITADNLRYFGEPVYEYDIRARASRMATWPPARSATCRVNLRTRRGITLDEIMARKPINALTGEAGVRGRSRRSATRPRASRTASSCRSASRPCARTCSTYLLETGGPEQKTIIFCASDRHADDVAAAMNNLYAEVVRPPTAANRLSRTPSSARRRQRQGLHARLARRPAATSSPPPRTC